MREQLPKIQLRASGIVRRWRRILDVRAADLQEEMAEQRFSVPSDPTKTAATSEHRASGASNQTERDARAALKKSARQSLR
ncbi:MAG TPA: hypothetical protein VJ820_15355 [Propionibacteriaceae bacterium]|nr:hypothetical protein [Propionibacteriaceae bacterium]